VNWSERNELRSSGQNLDRIYMIDHDKKIAKSIL
jgi:hypothetical protein